MYRKKRVFGSLCFLNAWVGDADHGDDPDQSYESDDHGENSKVLFLFLFVQIRVGHEFSYIIMSAKNRANR